MSRSSTSRGGPHRAESGSAPGAAPDREAWDAAGSFRVPTERILEFVGAFTKLTGLPLRIVLESGERSWPIHDTLGDVDRAKCTEQRWEMSPEETVRITVGPAARELSDVVLPLLQESLGRLLASERELRFFSHELAERYEEIALLTSISETLGSIIHLERAAGRLLDEVAAVMRADFAALWTPDEPAGELVLFAAGGSAPVEPARVSIDDAGTAISRVFTTQVDFLRGEGGPTDAGGDGRPFLAVPLRHSALHGRSRSVGVLGVRGEDGRPGFSPGDVKLAAAIGSHLAAAIENGRLVRESLEQERMLVELELAHHLQLKLLPAVGDFAELADIAARCEPADSVGGDFYHLFRLPGGKLGVMLGDVSSHGYPAGLIMALTMSAASITVREQEQPAEVLKGIHQELVRKLESTEMYMTVCYAVVDPGTGSLCYANAGHPHAYVINSAETRRLDALNPPLGIAEFDSYSQREVSWQPGLDTLLMFTDGISECLRSDQLWSDEILTEIARQAAAATAGAVLDRLFELACAPGGLAADDRTALVVK